MSKASYSYTFQVLKMLVKKVDSFNNSKKQLLPLTAIEYKYHLSHGKACNQEQEQVSWSRKKEDQGRGALPDTLESSPDKEENSKVFSKHNTENLLVLPHCELRSHEVAPNEEGVRKKL